MRAPPSDRSLRSSGLLRLETLLRLRWTAVLGQAGAVAIVHFGLGIPLPLMPIGLTLLVSVALNLGLRTRYPASHRVDEAAAFLLLAAEILQLSLLLYLTGGVKNPFAVFLLAPVLVSATALPAGRTLALIGLAVASLAALTFLAPPLPWIAGATLELPPEYRLALAIAFASALVFIGLLALRTADEGRQLVDALARAELILAREQHLRQLDGLAAAAAHQLGTPLGTIAVVVKELLNSHPVAGPLRDDLVLLKEQSDRCRVILASIAAKDFEPPDAEAPVPLSRLVETALDPYRRAGIRVLVERAGEGEEPRLAPNPSLAFGIGNLLQNAMEHARSRITLRFDWSEQTVRFRVFDDGPGYPKSVLARLGEPYNRPLRPAAPDAGGLGLGLFIAKTLIERDGATLIMGNGPRGGGAVVELVWPRHRFAAAGRAPAGTGARMPSCPAKDPP